MGFTGWLLKALPDEPEQQRVQTALPHGPLQPEERSHCLFGNNIEMADSSYHISLCLIDSRQKQKDARC
jgi:hypothetical protein